MMQRMQMMQMKKVAQMFQTWIGAKVIEFTIRTQAILVSFSR